MPSNRPKESRENPTVKKLREAGKPTVTVVGYVGSAGNADHVRIHPDIENVSSFIDVPMAAIVADEDVPDSQMPFGARCFWVLTDAAIVQGQSTTAGYLAGAVATSGWRAEPVPEAGAQAAAATIFSCSMVAICSSQAQCNTSLFSCSLVAICQSLNQCNTTVFSCSMVAICPSLSQCSTTFCSLVAICQSIKQCNTLSICGQTQVLCSMGLCRTIACPSLHNCPSTLTCR